jgi:hypothetical protein
LSEAPETSDAFNPELLQIAITGLTYSGPGQAIMQVTLETQHMGASGDLAWAPVFNISLTPHKDAGKTTLWTASIMLPSPRGSRPFRLLIEEFERFATGTPGQNQTRLVYAMS